MEFIRTFFRRLIALALFSQHMHQHRAIDFLRSLQNLGQSLQIVPIDGSQIGKAQLLKNRGGHHQILNTALKAANGLQHISAKFHIFQPAFNIMLDFVICFASAQLIQILTHGAHVFRNGHFVIVKHHNHFFMQGTGII